MGFRFAVVLAWVKAQEGRMRDVDVKHFCFYRTPKSGECTFPHLCADAAAPALALDLAASVVLNTSRA